MVQEPTAATTDSQKHSPRRLGPLYSAIIRYVPAVAIFFAVSIASEIFLLRNPSTVIYGALIILLGLPASIGLAFYFGGIVLQIHRHELLGTIFRSYAALSISVFLFFDTLFSLAILAGVPAGDVATLLISFTFLTNAIILNRLGNILISGKKDQPAGLMAKKLAIACGIFFLGRLFSFSVLMAWLSYPLDYAGLAYAGLSIAPMIAYSKRTENYREAGLYLVNSTLHWTIAAFFLGVAALILTTFQNSILSYAIVLTLSVIVIAILGFRMYSLGASRIEKETLGVYQRHSHKVAIVQDESFDYLRRSVNEFVSTGRNDRLLIALTSLLTNTGLSYEDTESMIKEIASYEVPPIYKIPYLNMKKGIELEMQNRIRIVNQTFNSIATRSGGRNGR